MGSNASQVELGVLSASADIVLEPKIYFAVADDPLGETGCTIEMQKLNKRCL